MVYSPRIKSDAFSAIIIMGAFTWPDVIVGITDPSTTRSRSTPRTLQHTKPHAKYLRAILLQTWTHIKERYCFIVYQTSYDRRQSHFHSCFLPFNFSYVKK